MLPPFCSGNHLNEEEIAGHFDYCVLTCVFVCSKVSFPYGAIGWSVICDCDISWPYALTVKPV